jgi:hypothetical protein
MPNFLAACNLLASPIIPNGLLSQSLNSQQYYPDTKKATLGKVAFR